MNSLVIQFSSMRCILAFLLCTTSFGCVKRTLTITSDPPNALVWVNDREVGRTPVELDFLYYGAYDVRIEHETCESIMTSRRIDAPWWDAPFIDIAAEALPVQMLSTPVWHFELSPKNNNLNDLLDRATLFRELEGGDQE